MKEILRDANERGTSACSVIQGCWVVVVGRRRVGFLMEDTHGDKACSYKDTKTRRDSKPLNYGTQPAGNPRQFPSWLCSSARLHTPQPHRRGFRKLHSVKFC